MFLIFLLHLQLSFFMARLIHLQPTLWELWGPGQVFTITAATKAALTSGSCLPPFPVHHPLFPALSHCYSQLILRHAQGHCSRAGPPLEKTFPLRITPSANVSPTSLLSCSSPSTSPCITPGRSPPPCLSDNWAASESSSRPAELMSSCQISNHLLPIPAGSFKEKQNKTKRPRTQ